MAESKQENKRQRTLAHGGLPASLDADNMAQLKVRAPSPR